jgi:two-component system OmpR family sensor kinase
VSHELRTPLTSIRGYAEGLADGAVEPEQASRVIRAEAGRLERLVADLLDLARLQRAGFSVQREPVDLDELAARVIERHQPRADALGVALRHESADTAAALADRDRLLQAASNLVENALRLTPAAGSVTVLTGPGRVAVRDTGPGLSDEDLPHVFERFYLYERYRSERAVGTGLGLAIVHDLTRLMGGEVTAQNAPDERGGAIFTLKLPVV